MCLAQTLKQILYSFLFFPLMVTIARLILNLFFNFSHIFCPYFSVPLIFFFLVFLINIILFSLSHLSVHLFFPLPLAPLHHLLSLSLWLSIFHPLHFVHCFADSAAASLRLPGKRQDTHTHFASLIITHTHTQMKVTRCWTKLKYLKVNLYSRLFPSPCNGVVTTEMSPETPIFHVCKL